MKMRLHFLALALLFVVSIMACQGNDSNTAAKPSLKGPALVMFYSDN